MDFGSKLDDLFVWAKFWQFSNGISKLAEKLQVAQVKLFDKYHAFNGLQSPCKCKNAILLLKVLSNEYMIAYVWTFLNGWLNFAGSPFHGHPLTLLSHANQWEESSVLFCTFLTIFWTCSEKTPSGHKLAEKNGYWVKIGWFVCLSKILAILKWYLKIGWEAPCSSGEIVWQ